MKCPESLVASITVAAITISKTLSDSELALVAAILTQLGDTLATIATCRGEEDKSAG